MYYNISDDDLDQWFPNEAHSSNWLADRKNNDDDNKLGQKMNLLITLHSGNPTHG